MRKPLYDTLKNDPELITESSLRIRKKINIDTLSPSVDFWVLGKNILIYSPDTRFFKDIVDIKFKYLSNRDRLTATLTVDTYSNNDTNPWTRDFISTKTPTDVYLFNNEVKYSFTYDGYHDLFSEKIITKNSNVSSYISDNYCGPRFFHSRHMAQHRIHPTQIAIPGGNIFHCVNARGEDYVIVGELGLVPQNKLKQTVPVDTHSHIGMKSYDKYSYNSFDEKYDIIRQRRLNKQILKKQCGNAQIVVVPNGFFYHLDLEICPLPNGVVLVHSYKESIRLLEKYKYQIMETLKEFPNPYNYFELYQKTHEHLLKTEHLFEKTKSKLTKRGFIVIPVCGFLTFSDNVDYIFASGFNGLPIVLQNGEILYTLPPNTDWFNEYFENVLIKAGVSFIQPIMSENLDYLARYKGFFRCQTNTIPKEMIVSDAFNPYSYSSKGILNNL